MSDSLWPYGLWPAWLLCPWDSPGKNTGVGRHALLQGLFPTQGSNSCLLELLHCRWIPYHWATRGSPIVSTINCICYYCNYYYCQIIKDTVHEHLGGKKWWALEVKCIHKELLFFYLIQQLTQKMYKFCPSFFFWSFRFYQCKISKKKEYFHN